MLLSLALLFKFHGIAEFPYLPSIEVNGALLFLPQFDMLMLRVSRINSSAALHPCLRHLWKIKNCLLGFHYDIFPHSGESRIYFVIALHSTIKPGKRCHGYSCDRSKLCWRNYPSKPEVARLHYHTGALVIIRRHSSVLYNFLPCQQVSVAQLVSAFGC